MKTKFKEPLESFLKKERVKSKFVNNIVTLNDVDIIDGINDTVSSNISRNATITGAFVFKETTEGSDFWCNVNEKWHKYIKK